MTAASGSSFAGQMMIGNQHRNAQCVGFGDTRNAGHTVVDSNQQRGRSVRRDADDFRRQPIAVLETIGHEVLDIGESELAQAAQHQRRAGRTVDIKVTDHDDLLVAVGNDELGGLVDILERADRGELCQSVVELPMPGSARAWRTAARAADRYRRVRR